MLKKSKLAWLNPVPCSFDEDSAVCCFASDFLSSGCLSLVPSFPEAKELKFEPLKLKSLSLIIAPLVKVAVESVYDFKIQLYFLNKLPPDFLW